MELVWMDVLVGSVIGFLVGILCRRRSLLPGGDSVKDLDTQEEMRKLYHAIEQSSVSVVITDTKGAIEYVNPKFEKTTGFTREEVMGMNPRILKSGETPIEEYGKLWKTILSGEEWRGEFHNRRKNGELYWELASISPVKNETGEVTHFVAVKEDVTERKRMEMALRESEAKFFQLSNSINDAIIMMDDKACISYWNRAATEMFGYTEGEALGQNLHALLTPEKYQEAFRKGFVEFQKSGDGPVVGSSRELSALRKDGSEFPIELSLSSVQVGENWHVIGLVRDIRQRKENEERLRGAERDRTLVETAGAAAHEINQPLSVVVGLAQVMLHSIPVEDDSYVDVEHIYNAGLEILKIVKEMQAVDTYQAKPYVGKANIVSFDGDVF
jgi:sigma-B regulation protein RsbU (phosphoserine phosphatase)